MVRLLMKFMLMNILMGMGMILIMLVVKAMAMATDRGVNSDQARLPLDANDWSLTLPRS